ncbi:hypothetical protein V6N12_024260 [Hibiscus sabdariffa]|uniref:Uncharacterized protein n=1 Tax=Hibiscus sabdariffa TaxID=183260 RepID=A0ABR2G025_9ROSI
MGKNNPVTRSDETLEDASIDTNLEPPCPADAFVVFGPVSRLFSGPPKSVEATLTAHVAKLFSASEPDTTTPTPSSVTVSQLSVTKLVETPLALVAMVAADATTEPI